MTIGQTDVPKLQKISSDDMMNVDQALQDEFSGIFFSTPEHYKGFRAGLLEQETELGARDVPVFMAKGSLVSIEIIKELNMDLNNLDYVFYCHETLEEIYVLPALKIKRKFEWNDCIPLMVSQSGSLSSLNAICLAQASLFDKQEGLALMLTVDSVEFNVLRYQFTGYLRGDSVSAIMLSSSAGDYQIIEVQKVNDGIPLSYPLWKEEDYQLAEQLMIEQAEKLILLALSTHEIDYIICQHLSDSFCQAIEVSSRQTSAEFFTRMQWADMNLLGNDPYISLQELEKEREIRVGKRILLLFASIDFGVGYLILQK